MAKLYRAFISEKQETDTAARTVTAVVSSEAVDRTAEVMIAAGARLKRYRQNPVVMWAHQYGGLPIGRNLWIKVDGDRIIAKTAFAQTEQAEQVEVLN